MAYQYIISRRIDPFFAVAIGFAAAVTRINREEKEKGRTTNDSLEALKRRFRLAWQNKD